MKRNCNDPVSADPMRPFPTGLRGRGILAEVPGQHAQQQRKDERGLGRKRERERDRERQRGRGREEEMKRGREEEREGRREGGTEGRREGEKESRSKRGRGRERHVGMCHT